MTRALLLALLLTGCAATQQDPCAPLWGTAIAAGTLAVVGELGARAETNETARDVEQITTIALSSGTVLAVAGAARCEGRRPRQPQ